MKRKYKRRTSRFGIFFVFLTAVTIAGVFFIPWAMKPDNFRNEKNKINSWLNGRFYFTFCVNAKNGIKYRMVIGRESRESAYRP